MGINRVLAVTLLTVFGCATTDTGPAIDAVNADVAERTGVKLEHDAERVGSEALARVVASKLRGEMSADDAVAVSLLKNPTLRALYRELGVAQSDVVAAGLPANPAFSAERRLGGRAAEFDVAQEFVGLFLLPLRRRLAESQFAHERFRVTQQVLDHTAEVRRAYVRAVAAGQQVEMRRTVLTTASAAAVAARAMRAAGNNSALDVARTQSEVNRARLALTDAEVELVEARERVNTLLGLWGAETGWGQPTRLTDPPEADTPADGLERLAVAGRPDLAARRAELVALAQSLGLTQITSVLPELTLGFHTETEPEGNTTRGPSASLPIPLFDRGQAERARAEQLFLHAQDRYAALAIEVRSEVRTAFARMGAARKKVGFYRRAVLPTQETVTAQTQLLYNGMFTGVFDLLAARHQQVEATREYILALADYWLARTDLERALGRRLSDGGAVVQHQNERKERR